VTRCRASSRGAGIRCPNVEAIVLTDGCLVELSLARDHISCIRLCLDPGRTCSPEDVSRAPRFIHSSVRFPRLEVGQSEQWILGRLLCIVVEQTESFKR
jgi:hypothetical protein